MALAAAANRQRKGVPKIRRFLMKASTTIWKGGLVSVNTADGLAVPATDAANDIVVGVAAESKVSAATGSYWIPVEYDAEWKFTATSITQLMVGDGLCVVDDDEIDDAGDTTNDIVVGKMTEFIGVTSCWCYVKGLTT
jgi:hypothetical protein